MENILTINGCFNCVTSRIKALGWLKKKKDERGKADERRKEEDERRKEEDEKFWILNLLVYLHSHSTDNL